jgi:hypothetical protein
MGTATVLKNAHSARVSRESVSEFAGNVAELLRSSAARAALAAAGREDASAWSAPVLMARVVELYTRLSENSHTPAAAKPAAPAALSS